MDIYKINYFFTAAELGNFTKAADKCNIAQTTMSKYISQLEDEVGCKLFVRTNKACYLTERGRIFYASMSKIYSDYRDLLGQLNNSIEQEIKIGLQGDFTSVPLISRFGDENPQIKLFFSFGNHSNLRSALERQKIDAMVSPNHYPDSKRKEDPFEKLDMNSQLEVLACSKKLLEDKGSINDVISQAPFITKSTDNAYHNYCRETLNDYFGCTFQKITTVDSYSKQLLMLNLDNGFAILPEEEVCGNDKIVTFDPNGIFHDTLQLIYNKKNISASLNELIEFIRGHKS